MYRNANKVADFAEENSTASSAEKYEDDPQARLKMQKSFRLLIFNACS